MRFRFVDIKNGRHTHVLGICTEYIPPGTPPHDRISLCHWRSMLPVSSPQVHTMWQRMPFRSISFDPADDHRRYSPGIDRKYPQNVVGFIVKQLAKTSSHSCGIAVAGKAVYPHQCMVICVARNRIHGMMRPVTYILDRYRLSWSSIVCRNTPSPLPCMKMIFDPGLFFKAFMCR